MAGPVEATALGNLLVQVRANGELSSLSEIRDVVRTSNKVKAYQPGGSAPWDEAAGAVL
jgi:rhamnulokinase